MISLLWLLTMNYVYCIDGPESIALIQTKRGPGDNSNACKKNVNEMTA